MGDISVCALLSQLNQVATVERIGSQSQLRSKLERIQLRCAKMEVAGCDQNVQLEYGSKYGGRRTNEDAVDPAATHHHGCGARTVFKLTNSNFQV